MEDFYLISDALYSFQVNDLLESSIMFFKAINIIERSFEEKVELLDINKFMYLYCKEKIFTKEDIQYLKSIKSIAMLYDMHYEYEFLEMCDFKCEDEKIKILIIEIKEEDSERSAYATNLTRIMNNIFHERILILIKNYNYIILTSEIEAENNKENIYLSEWFDTRNITEELIWNISEWSSLNYSYNSMDEFYIEITYSFCRDYYKYIPTIKLTFEELQEEEYELLSSDDLKSKTIRYENIIKQNIYEIYGNDYIDMEELYISNNVDKEILEDLNFDEESYSYESNKKYLDISNIKLEGQMNKDLYFETNEGIVEVLEDYDKNNEEMLEDLNSDNEDYDYEYMKEKVENYDNNNQEQIKFNFDNYEEDNLNIESKLELIDNEIFEDPLKLLEYLEKNDS